jgi:drug/metabolite transporter (DMT)-like permease
MSWYLLGGVMGTALLLAGTVTKHVPYMGSNMSLTALSPLLLLAAVGWAWRRESSRRGRAARGLAAVVAVLAVAGLALMHVPGFSQQSMMVMMTVVPVHVALAALAARGTRPVRTEPVSQVLSS